MTSLNRKTCNWLMSLSDSEPGGVHFGTLPAAGLRAGAGLGAWLMADWAGLLGASLAAGGLLTGVEAAGRQIKSNHLGG